MHSFTHQPATVLMAGGGTGGHLLPGVALAREIVVQQPQAKVVFFVPGKPVDVKIMEQTEFSWLCNPMRSFPGSFSQMTEFINRFCQSWLLSETLFRRTRPHVVVGLGGYGAFSAGILASLHKTPMVLLESNMIAGKVVRWLSHVCHSIYAPGQVQGLPTEKIMSTGIPLRQDLLGNIADPCLMQSVDVIPAQAGIQEICDIPGSRVKPGMTNRNESGMTHYCNNSTIQILVMGGSQGAHCINDTMCKTLPLLKRANQKIKFIHLAGNVDCGKINHLYSQYGFTAEVHQFAHNICELYRKSNLVICRAGGGTIAEITALGLPSILIPFARAAHCHQEKNATRLKKANAACVIAESQLSPQFLADEIERLIASPQLLKDMAKAAKLLGKPSAGREIAAHILALINKGV